MGNIRGTDPTRPDHHEFACARCEHVAYSFVDAGASARRGLRGRATKGDPMKMRWILVTIRLLVLLAGMLSLSGCKIIDIG